MTCSIAPFARIIGHHFNDKEFDMANPREPGSTAMVKQILQTNRSEFIEARAQQVTKLTNDLEVVQEVLQDTLDLAMLQSINLHDAVEDLDATAKNADKTRKTLSKMDEMQSRSCCLML